MSSPTMQSLYFTAPGQVAVREEPRPVPRAGEVLIATLYSAISPGSERLVLAGAIGGETTLDATLPDFGGGLRYPVRYGYILVGRVAAVGPEVDRSWLDRLVFAFKPHGSHAIARVEELALVPAELSAEEATFFANMETAVSLVMDGRPLMGERVAVFGQGVVGLLLVALLAEWSALDVTAIEPSPKRRELAQGLGAARALAPAEASIHLARLAADLTYEVSGSPAALSEALALAPFASRLVVGSWYGDQDVSVPLGSAFHRNQIELRSSQVSRLQPSLLGRFDKARRVALTWAALMRAAERSLPLTRLISHRLPIHEAETAYALVASRDEEALQILFTY